LITVTDNQAKFHVGQLVQHLKFGYRGVIFDVDPEFQETQEWYDAMATSRPPKDRPWYRVLVHDESHTTYVAERNLGPETAPSPIEHPLVEALFSGFEDGRYLTGHTYN
jgi:heat shock protein HspQ